MFEEATNVLFNMRARGEDPLDRFRHVADHSFDHVVITDAAGYVIYANRAAAKNTGYAMTEMVGGKPSLWGRQMSADYYRRMWRTIARERAVFESEITNRRKSGALYTAQIRIVPVANSHDAIAYFVSIERDISHARHREEGSAHLARKYGLALAELECAQARYRLLVEQLPLPALFADEDGMTVFANSAFRMLSSLIPDPCGAPARDVLRLLELEYVEIPDAGADGHIARLFVCR